MLCEQVRDHLSAYLDKELTADLSAAVRAHVDACPDCRSLLEDLRATSNLLRRLPVHAAPEGLAGDVMREMERRVVLESSETEPGQPHERTLAIHRTRSWPRALAVAATLLLAAGIGLFAYLGGRPGDVAPSVEFARGTLERNGEAPAPEPGDGPAEPAGPTDLAHKGLGVDGGKRQWADEAGSAAGFRHRGIVAGDLLGDHLGRHLDGDENGAARLGSALAIAPTAGIANIEDAAGRQSIVGNATGGRSGAATQGLGERHKKAPDRDLGSASAGVAEGGRPSADGYGYRSNGSVRHLYGGLAAVDAKTKRLAPPGTDALAAGMVVRAEKQDAGEEDAASQLAGPAVVQQVMNFVAEGRATIDTLQAVATPANLGPAENQLIVRAASREVANTALVQLFHANRWEALPQEKATAYFRDGRLTAEVNGDRAHAIGGAGSTGRARKKAEKPVAGGCYFLASRNGEDTWVILTDRDQLSRFGGQLAQANEMAVGMDSSKQFRAIGQLQKQLSEYAVAKGDTALMGRAPARGRSWARAASEAAPTDLAKLAETQARLRRAVPSREEKLEEEAVRTAPTEKLKEARSGEAFGLGGTERIAQKPDGLKDRSDDDARWGTKRSPAHRPAAPGRASGTAAADAAKTAPAEPKALAKAPAAEAPAIATRGFAPSSGKKAADGPAAVVPPAPPAKPSTTARSAPLAPTATPPAKPKPAARATVEDEEAPSGAVAEHREADELGAGQAKDATLKTREIRDGDKQRWNFSERTEADKLRNGIAKQHGTAKPPVRLHVEGAKAGRRGAAAPPTTFSIAGGTVALHRVLALPKNQVLLVVRVRQASETAATTAGEPAAAEAEARPAAKEAAH